MTPSVQIKDFLAIAFEGYLLSDLETMDSAQPPASVGHVGFPMVMTCLSGIELLGSLSSARTYDRMAGARYFRDYWSAYLYPDNGQLGDPFYKLVRHGLAHCFLPRQSIVITKHDPQRHLASANGQFFVDASTLSNDLRSSYFERFVPALGSLQAQDRLTEMLRDWTDDSEKPLKRLLAEARQSPVLILPPGHPPTPSSLPTASSTSIPLAPSGASFIGVSTKAQPQASVNSPTPVTAFLKGDPQ